MELGWQEMGTDIAGYIGKHLFSTFYARTRMGYLLFGFRIDVLKSYFSCIRVLSGQTDGYLPWSSARWMREEL